MGEPPIVIMLAGANGAGKTTTATTLFREVLQSVHFVNADTIAQGLSGGDPDSVALQAGSIMLKRIHELAEKRQDFAFETTGASRSFARMLLNLKKCGYEYRFYYFWLRNADIAVERVAERVRGGGHAVPEETIRRRYERGLRNLFKMYIPLANYWTIIDNTEIALPLPVAEGKGGGSVLVYDQKIWNDLKSGYDK